MEQFRLNRTQEFALSLANEYLPEMSETRRDFVIRFYRELIRTPQWIDYVIVRAVNDSLDIMPDREKGLFWFRKNYSMLENWYLEQ